MEFQTFAMEADCPRDALSLKTAQATEYEEVQRGERLDHPHYCEEDLTTFEEQEHTLSGRNATEGPIKIILTYATDECFGSYETVHLTAHHEGRCIAQATGMYTECVSGPIAHMLPSKGSGCFGPEIMDGVHFKLDEIVVARAWRGKGLGKLLIKKMLEREEPDFVFVVPEHVLEDLELECQGKTPSERAEIERRLDEGRLAFYRSLGFRRLGAMSFFCRASNSHHSSRLLPPQSDYDPPQQKLPSHFSSGTGLTSDLSMDTDSSFTSATESLSAHASIATSSSVSDFTADDFVHPTGFDLKAKGVVGLTLKCADTGHNLEANLAVHVGPTLKPRAASLSTASATGSSSHRHLSALFPAPVRALFRGRSFSI